MHLQNWQAEFAEALNNDGDRLTIITPEANLSIYQNNILSNLMNALEDTYPMIKELLGKDFFRLAAREYIKHYPSRTSNLHQYGEYFSDFLTHFQPLKDLVYIPEVAYFEWVCQQLTFAAQATPIDVKRLEYISEEQYPQLHFILHPASQVHKFYFPILRIIDLCKGELQGTLNINEGGVNLLIIRRTTSISLVTLTNAEFAFLDAIQEGLTLQKALDLSLAIDKTFNLDERLPQWIAEMTIVDFYLTAES